MNNCFFIAPVIAITNVPQNGYLIGIKAILSQIPGITESTSDTWDVHWAVGASDFLDAHRAVVVSLISLISGMCTGRWVTG